MIVQPNLGMAYTKAGKTLLETGYPVKTEAWQGMKNPPTFLEVLNITLCGLIHTKELSREVLNPNLPWADIHFDERVSGKPLNPGKSYKQWPFYGSDAKVRTENEKFTHTYMERYWPKLAGVPYEVDDLHYPPNRMGIRYDYGDLKDLINLLASEPHTRQAYLPVWFPEDTGVKHGGRVPCSIGYHLIRRGNYLHIIYQLRSCDYLRHLADDLYLTVKLLVWVLDYLKRLDYKTWQEVIPGTLTTHITSLHIFEIEKPKLNLLVNR